MFLDITFTMTIFSKLLLYVQIAYVDSFITAIFSEKSVPQNGRFTLYFKFKISEHAHLNGCTALVLMRRTV